MIKAGVSVLAFACLLGASAGQDRSVPDSATIRERIAAAAGPVPSNFREAFSVEEPDGGWTQRMLRRDDDWREITDRPPFHEERGESKGQSWWQNRNGQTCLAQPEPGEATRESRSTTVSRIHQPVDGYLIATLTPRGTGTKEYVDATSWRTVQREVVTANGTVVTKYDDFRSDHGRTFTHRWTVDDGVHRRSTTMRVTEYTPGAVSENDVRIPPPRRALVEFPSGANDVTLPATFETNHIAVRVTINGKGYDFVLDSGASGILIDEAVARELDLPQYHKRSRVTADRYEEADTVVPEMRVGGLVMHQVAAHVGPLGWNTGRGVKEVGLLGFDFLAELGVRIDYENKRVVVTPGDRFKAPASPQATQLDIRLGTAQPMVTVSINGAVGERWVFDTGGSGSFLIFDYFARRHPEAVRNEGAAPESYRVRHYGIGGRFDTKPYRIASLKIANLNFQDFTGYRVTQRGAYDANTDGLIGPQFFRLFTVYLNYGESTITLVPNAEGRRVMRR